MISKIIPRRKAIALVMGVFLPIALLFWFYFGIMSLKPISVGERLPEFMLPTLEGGYVSLSDTDERTLLVFLSSKCPSCLDEIDHLDTLQEITDSRNIELIIILDADYRTTAALFANKSVHGHISYDGKSISSDLGIRFEPAFLFVKKHRILSQIEYGYMTEERILSFISVL
jgi:thioredoxin-related protein